MNGTSNNNVPQPFRAWRQSRFGFVATQFALLLVAFFAMRLILFFKFHPANTSLSDNLQAFLLGFHLDCTVALALSFPILIWCVIIPNKWFGARWHRIFFTGVCFFLWCVQIFLLFAEYYFFEEFKSRFNTVAIDYVAYPYEVFSNISQSYPVTIVVTASVLAALFLVYLSRRCAPLIWVTISPRSKLLHFVCAALVTVGMIFTVSFQESRFSKNRTLNEISNNGMVSLAAAAWSRNLEYDVFYLTAAKNEACERTRKILTEPNTKFVGDSIERRVAGDPNRPRLNVVLFLEESLGSEFWGSLGRKEPTLTPHLDKLANEEGMLFENLYATGNRTVRGFEGVLSSFPPLPGDSIVHRDRSENVETIARVLKRDGYETVFLYGGSGFFDDMRSFTIRNGYDRFIEQKDFPNPTFTTAWGVCNEDLYARAVTEFRELDRKKAPFFATLLSVSNHKPYLYPPGRIPEDPKKKRRDYAVKYTDWALGQFFDAAKKESFWTNTLFVVVADHGARVYGSQTIPIHSYEIPLLILGPAFVKTPSRHAQLGCQLDVTPTILGLLGRPYKSLFFGRDLLHTPDENGFALLNHNRDIGLFKDNRFAILGLNKGAEFFRGNPKTEEMVRNDHPDAEDLELQRDAIALFQTADDLYMNRRYRLDP